MKITVRYFASVREHIGLSQETIDTQSADLAALRMELISKGENYSNGLSAGKAIRMALNQQVCDDNALLTENAEVAFFPPVTGG
ncbi:MAG: molybdopterin converting factor subunit 1 [Betaproteobacteria bacterium]|jgi:molybdopterin synthase sulfur carrier subunit|nr:molybdopterin converting factor subunit 1 [Betaproteobacteria bacterium]